MMTSRQLADLLRQQVDAGGPIVLDDSVLGKTGLDALVTRDLRRDDGRLLLAVDAAAIPTDPPVAGFSLDAAVPSGSDGFLDLDDRGATAAFAFSSDAIGVTLTVTPRATGSGATADWTLSDSFPQLAYQACDALNIVGPRLVLSSTGAVPGLSFSAELALDGYLAVVLELMHLSGRFALTGLLTRDDQGDLSFALEADLGLPTFEIGSIIALKDPRIGAEPRRR